MKNFKSISALAAALLSTSVFAGGLGLGLGVGANVDAGVGLGLGNSGSVGVGIQSNARQQVDAGVDERTTAGTQRSAPVRANSRTQIDSSSSNMNDTPRNERRTNSVGASGAVAAEGAERVSSGIGSGAQRVQSNVRSNVAVDGQSMQTRERRQEADSGISSSVRANEQIRRDRAASTSLKATIKQNAELYTGG